MRRSLSSIGEPIVGRQSHLDSLSTLADQGARLVTVSGPPGVGKSRLVAEWTRIVARDVTWVELDGVSSIEAALDRAAGALGVDREPDEPWSTVFATAFRRRPGLALVADGFDRLVGSGEKIVAEWLEAGSDLTVVVTARERLGLSLERSVIVGPLPVDRSIELFECRARRLLPDFSADASEDALVDLVVELDGNPLAIELAAARVRTFPPRELLQRLDRRFALLRDRDSGASLAGAIGVSWELLTAAEREILQQCTVFRGGFTLDAAEAVLRSSATDAPWVLDVVDALVEKSLLYRIDAQGRARLDMYRSVRDFVAEEAGEPERSTITRHAEYYADREPAWSDAENLHALVDRWRGGKVAPELAARAALRLDPLMRRSGTTSMHANVLRQGIDAARESEEHLMLSDLLFASGELALVLGRLNDAERDFGEASEVTSGDRSARAAIRCAEVERRTGRVGEALRRLEAVAATVRGSDRERHLLAHRAAALCDAGRLEEAEATLVAVPPPGELDLLDEYAALKRLAYAHYYLGHSEHQQALNQRALELARAAEDRRRVAQALQGLGDAAFARGDFVEACDRYEEALAAHRALGNLHLEGVLLGNQGAAYHRLDELERAARCYDASLAIHRQTGAHPYEAVVTYARGVLEHERGHLDDALFLYARATALFEELDQREDVASTRFCLFLLFAERGEHDRARRELAELEDAARTQAWLGETPTLLRAWLEAVDETALAAARESVLQSMRGRLPARVLARSSDGGVAAAADRKGLVVGEGGEWFQVAGGEPVNLRRRRAHRLILARLVELHRTDEVLDVYGAFDVGWPGESADAESAAERVYWAIGSLRKLGLDGILLTSDAGYVLDPATSITMGKKTPPRE